MVRCSNIQENTYQYMYTMIQCMYAFMPEVTIPEFKISNKSHKLLLVGEGEMDKIIILW